MSSEQLIVHQDQKEKPHVLLASLLAGIVINRDLEEEDYSSLSAVEFRALVLLVVVAALTFGVVVRLL
jgi:hypothetical protein